MPGRTKKNIVPAINLDHETLKHRRTRIVATIGPASQSDARLKKLIRAGLNVARINFSHGDPAEHVALIKRIRKLAAQQNAVVAILADLCGPKVRVGTFAGGAVRLKEKDEVTITTRQVTGTASLIPSQYKGIVREAKTGDRVLLDDGNLELKVLEKKGDVLKAKVIRGGVLKDRKGMNLPDTVMKISALTSKDRNDVLYCIRADVDYIALSFVRYAEDIRALKNLLKKNGAAIPVVAKIEKPEALANIGAILDAADGIMVARGDLGVELPPQKVPFYQDRLIALANEANKPVIVATQMLESMIEHGRPTRAEVSDVAGASLAGADAVMLSAETAAGAYPLESFGMMDTILRETEAHQYFMHGGLFNKAGVDRKADLQDILGIATAQLSRDLKVRAIYVLTRSGYTARMVSADRPSAPIFALTRDRRVQQRLNLYWGVNASLADRELSPEEYSAWCAVHAKKNKLGTKGQYILLLAGFGGGSRETNSIMVHQIG